jgi:hypothetical protein
MTALHKIADRQRNAILRDALFAACLVFTAALSASVVNDIAAINAGAGTPPPSSMAMLSRDPLRAP